MRADIVVQAGKSIGTGEPARRAFLFQYVDRPNPRVFLQEVSQRQGAQAAAENSKTHIRLRVKMCFHTLSLSDCRSIGAIVDAQSQVLAAEWKARQNFLQWAKPPKAARGK